jgi:hypothetical protein
MRQDEESFEAMSPTGELGNKAQHERTFGTRLMPESLTGRFAVDPAKALVMSHIGQLVSDGYAEWSLLDNGDVELRFLSGEVFVLADTTITRVI